MRLIRNCNQPPLVQHYNPLSCRLYELNEHIEILDATINYKNSSINSQELHLAQIVADNEEDDHSQIGQLNHKLHSLPLVDARALLVSYFHKVVSLRLKEGKEAQRQRELEAELEQQKVATKRLERSLRQTRVNCERELLSQQKVCASHMYVTCSCVTLNYSTLGT